MTQLLESYNCETSLAITPKLHCTVPCLTMGIPVGFTDKNDDYRTTILRDIGLEVRPYRLPESKPLRLLTWALYKTLGLGYGRKNVWNPKLLDIEAEKETVRFQLTAQLAKRLGERERKREFA